MICMTQSQYPVRPVIRGAADREVPENVHIEYNQMRASGADRDRYEKHLNACWGSEQLSDDEFSARTVAARKAATIADLVLLISDLPPLPLEVKAEKARQKAARKHWYQRAWAQPGGRITLCIAGQIICVSMAAAGGMLIAVARPSPWPVPLLVAGVIGFISLFVYTAIQTNEIRLSGKDMHWKSH
jgi:Domain of unknown function (DUF1707)